MKKILKLFLSGAMVLCLGVALSGCGKGDDKKDEKGNVAVLYYNYSDTYISSVRTALDKQLKDAGVDFQDYDGNNNQTTQTEQVTTAITKGAKVLVVNIVNTSSDDAANGIVEEAKKADIPVIFFNREVSNEVVKSYEKCAFVGTDAAEAGHLQGKMIGEFLMKNYDKYDLNKDGKISYVMMMGEKGNKEAIYRTQYSVEDANKVLKDAGKPELEFYDAANSDKYLVDKDGKWSAQAANEYMTTLLSSYSDANKNMVELAICNNDGMAEGVVTALNTAGYNDGKEKSIPIFGVDATDAAKALIKSGKMMGTIKQDADGMAKAIALLVGNANDGKKLLDGTKDYNIDKDAAKIRIAYAQYLGE
ncbi:MAG: galactose ABC transporter substrate-binding protein [Erysipelotrichaceae bacterium]